MPQTKEITVALFGNFYPRFDRAATVTTAIAVCLARESDVSNVILYAPTGSSIPAEAQEYPKIDLRTFWALDDPLSLMRCTIEMFRQRGSWSEVLFNIFPTAFGRSRVSNAIGLLLPTILAVVGRKRVVVLMHNLFETQDAAGLGYRANLVEKLAVRGLESGVIHSTKLMVPLSCQARKVQEAFGKAVRCCFIPYADSILELLRPTALKRKPRGDSTVHILLFGAWGPQKDLDGALNAIRGLMKDDEHLFLTVAGGANTNFPGYNRRVEQLVMTMPGMRVRRLVHVRDEEVAPLFLDTDVLVLPYNAAGGNSGVLNLGSLYKTRIVAYDSPELRETASRLSVNVSFVKSGNYHALADAIAREVARARESPSTEAVPKGPVLFQLGAAVRELAGL